MTELEPSAVASSMASRPRTKNKPSKKHQQQQKRNKSMAAVPKNKKPSLKMQKLYRKRARDYDSDDEDNDADVEEEIEQSSCEDDDESSSDDDNVDIQESKKRKITMFSEGSIAFRTAFLKIMKISVPDDSLGPILAAQKKLVAKKLADEEAEHHSKGEKKKERQLAAEKGHVKPPANFFDAKEKNLISVATKGVVKLFNAVSKAQNPQKDLNPSRSKDAKVLAKRRKENFLSELQKPITQASHAMNNDNEPGWAPLRNSYMLGTKLKDWDKMPVPAATVSQDASMDSSSDEED